MQLISPTLMSLDSIDEVPTPDAPKPIPDLSSREMEAIMMGEGEEPELPGLNMTVDQIEQLVFEDDPVLLPSIAQVTSEQMERSLAALTEDSPPEAKQEPVTLNSAEMEILQQAA